MKVFSFALTAAVTILGAVLASHYGADAQVLAATAAGATTWAAIRSAQ